MCLHLVVVCQWLGSKHLGNKVVLFTDDKVKPNCVSVVETVKQVVLLAVVSTQVVIVSWRSLCLNHQVKI